MDYHGRIMNIEQTPPAYINNHPTDSRHNAYSVGHRDARHAAAEIVCEADKALRAKDAEIASLRDRLRDTAQILIAEVGATGPADAAEVARKAVSQIARLREALSVIAYPLNIGKVYHMDAVTQARAALAQVAEVGK